MPVVFVGHGTPMNALEENSFTGGWREMAAAVPKPEAILAVSAHWFTRGTRVQTEAHPRTVHDFYGFPRELYRISYPSPGAPALARRAETLLGGAEADDSWGIDHGAWSVLRRMYPDADIPVCQLSIAAGLSPREYFALGEKLRPLREENVLILGSGNVVHNLNAADPSLHIGYDWAQEFDGYIRSRVEAGDSAGVIAYRKAGECANYAFSTPEHFAPLLYALGAAGNSRPSVYNAACTLGSISMTSYLFSE